MTNVLLFFRNQQQLNTSTSSSISTGEAPPQPPQRISSIRLQQQQQLQLQQQQQQLQLLSANANSPSSTINSSHQSSNLVRKETIAGAPERRKMPPPLKEIDLESNYSLYFHKVTEFPAPIPFLNVAKTFPSKMRPQQQQQSHQ